MQSYIDKGYVIISSENVTKRIKEICPTAKIYDGNKEIPIEVMLESRKYLVDPYFGESPIVKLIKDNQKNMVLDYFPTNKMLDEFEEHYKLENIKRINQKEHRKMNKLYYIVEKDLIVCSIPTGGIPKEIKQNIANEIKESSGVKNVLVVEGEFHYIYNPCEVIETSLNFCLAADSGTGMNL